MHVTGLYLNAQGHPGIGHEVAVIRMGRTAWLPGVVALYGTFLFAVQALDRVVGIQYPRRKTEYGTGAVGKVLISPGKCLDLVKGGQSSANRVLGSN